MKILGWIHFSLALWGLSLSDNLGNGMDNNFYDELKKFFNNIENSSSPASTIFPVGTLTSQNGCLKNEALEINHNSFSFEFYLLYQNFTYHI